jgi:hypothetical protein
MKKILLSFIIILSIFMLFSCQSANVEVNSEANQENQPLDLDNVANGNKSEVQIVNKESSNESVINDAEASKENDADKIANDENMLNEDENQEDNKVTNEFILKAIVKEIQNDRIVVEVIESDYAFGIYHILTFDTTKYLNANGSLINRSNIKIGDTIELTYSGQTMLSYPPQVVAYSIRIAK